jgi:hypothetical protein
MPGMTPATGRGEGGARVAEDGSRPGDFYVSASADDKNYWQPSGSTSRGRGRPS